MSSSAGINGTAVAVSLTGAIILYSGVKGYSVSKTLRAFLQGSPPTDAAIIHPVSDGTPTPADGSGTGTHNFAGGPPPSGTGGNWFGQIESFMRNDLGFSRAGTAGALGNIRVESNFNPSAWNPGERARGFCQWEHGRRDGLIAYAKAHGMNETDGQAQLGWMRAELLTAFSPVYLYMRAAGDPASAAAFWDAHYEISSGDSRQERIGYAQQYYSQIAA